MTTDDFKQAAHKALDAMEGGPEQWTFLGFKRTHSGAFRCVLVLVLAVVAAAAAET